MSGDWQARFEIVSGPNDGLTFTMTAQGVALDGELLGAPPGSGLAPKDLDDVKVEAGGDGITLTCEVSFWIDGREVHGRQAVREGDIVRVGMTEMVLLGHSCGPARPQAAPRRCLRPGCGAVNPPDATWCRTCGWDLEDAE